MRALDSATKDNVSSRTCSALSVALFIILNNAFNVSFVAGSIIIRAVHVVVFSKMISE